MLDKIKITLPCLPMLLWITAGIQSQRVVALVSGSAQQPPNTLADKERKSGWKLLFDGKTTEGWRNYGSKEISPKWKVVDGALTKEERDAGDIITKDEYEWFELSIEYRISKGGNSGIMFRVTEEEIKPYMTGPEIQVQDNQNWRDPELAGWLYGLYRPTIDPKTGSPLDATKPFGEWNHLRIILAPDNCETYMNGVKYYQYQFGSADWDHRVSNSKFKAWPRFGKSKRGHIDLQDHGAPVAYRNIKIREIEPR